VGNFCVASVLHLNGVLVVMAIIIKKHVHPTSLAVLLEADGEQCPVRIWVNWNQEFGNLLLRRSRIWKFTRSFASLREVFKSKRSTDVGGICG
jgi:hypothetical protein